MKVKVGEKRNKILEFWQARQAARKSVAEKVEVRSQQGGRKEL